MTTTTAPAHFVKDFAKLSTALAPFAFQTEDGAWLLKGNAPEDLTRPYRSLVQMGYANGWLR